MRLRKTTRNLLSLYGVASLYPPQREAIERRVEYGENLVVASPTASGKTLIGLIGIANSLADNPDGLAVYTAPLRSIAYEKVDRFNKLSKMGIRVRVEVGNYSRGPRNANLLITTYEKLDLLIRNNPGLVSRLSSIVVDEIHYIGDEKRGPVLESLITRIIYEKDDVQVIGLSATIPNARELASWIGASLIESQWRPVPLREGVYKNGIIHRLDGEEEIETRHPKPYMNVVQYFADRGGQVLVFSQSRRRVVSLAKQSAKKLELDYDRDIARQASREIMGTEGPRALREELAGLILKGVSFHHAGLSNAQRMIIEKAFRQGGIAVIHATPTLAAGVNLPARAVVVEEYYRFDAGLRRPIRVYEYKQLAGRAGRPGYDDIGDAVIIAGRGDDVEELLQYYISGEVEPVESRLAGVRGLRHAILGFIASGAANTRGKIAELTSKSFYAHTRGRERVRRTSMRALGDLVKWGLVVEEEGVLTPTMLGTEVSRRYLDPLTVPVIRGILQRARRFDEYVLLYMIGSSPDMVRVPVPRSEAERLMDRVVEEADSLIDVIEWFSDDELRAVKIMFILRDWVNEAGDDTISERYGIGPGDLASITETAEWIAASLSAIAPLLGAPARLQGELSVLAQRIKYGVREELLQLVAIPGIGRVRARRLYNAGYRTLHDLATATPGELLRIQGIGPGVVRAILEFFGRGEEAEAYKETVDREKKGLEAFMD